LRHLNILQKNEQAKIPVEIAGLYNLTTFKCYVVEHFKHQYEYNNKMLITLSSYFDKSKLHNDITHLNILDLLCSGYTGNFKYLDNLPTNLTHLKINPLLVSLTNLPINLKNLSIVIKKDYDIEKNIKLPFDCNLEIIYLEDQ
jgi:hypothetical protein